MKINNPLKLTVSEKHVSESNVAMDDLFRPFVRLIATRYMLQCLTQMLDYVGLQPGGNVLAFRKLFKASPDHFIGYSHMLAIANPFHARQ